MNQRKQNISRWYALGLAMVLTAGCLIASTGIAYARYRTQGTREFLFEPRPSSAVGVGVMYEEMLYTEVTSQDEFTPQWTTITQTVEGESGVTTNEVYALDFAIYHDVADSPSISAQVRLVASLDAWDPASGGNALLVYQEGETTRTFTAEVAPIGENTTLYHEFGEGWVFRFLDEYGREASWELEYSTQADIGAVPIQILLDPSAVKNTSLLQLQVLGEWAE